MARTPAKRQSTPAVTHNCPTESNESRMVGTQHTPATVRLTVRPLRSIAVRCMSPTATQRWGEPSTPRTEVYHKAPR
eukprot:438559-Pleurochrysis_carterae.AAC.1